MTILYVNSELNRIEAICKKEDPMWVEMGCVKVEVPDSFVYSVEYTNGEGELRRREMTATELYASMTYVEYRYGEYPPITDYLDAVVKGDQTQIDKYIADCQAVKAKYPKPTE